MILIRVRLHIQQLVPAHVPKFWVIYSKSRHTEPIQVRPDLNFENPTLQTKESDNRVKMDEKGV